MRGMFRNLGDYARALWELRRLRRFTASPSFDQAFAFTRKHVGLTQHDDEIRWLWELVRAEAPRSVLEIGLDRGGTLFLWTRAAAPDAHLISMDTRPSGRLGQCSPFALTRRRFARPSQRVDLLLGTDSHLRSSRTRVEEMLDGAPIDFLFIDGDHSFEGVAEDFRLYSPLVRPGGVIAFHDIAQSATPATEGVARFWREFAAQHPTEERVAGADPGFGIGVYRVPDDASA